MLLGLQPPRYVVHPHYAERLKQLLELTNDMEGGLPLEYDVKTLEVSLNAPHSICLIWLSHSCQAQQSAAPAGDTDTAHVAS